MEVYYYCCYYYLGFDYYSYYSFHILHNDEDFQYFRKKLEKFDLNYPNELENIMKKHKLNNKKIILLNFSVIKENKLLVNVSNNNLLQSYKINISGHINLVKFFLPIIL